LAGGPRCRRGRLRIQAAPGERPSTRRCAAARDRHHPERNLPISGPAGSLRVIFHTVAAQTPSRRPLASRISIKISRNLSSRPGSQMSTAEVQCGSDTEPQWAPRDCPVSRLGALRQGRVGATVSRRAAAGESARKCGRGSTQVRDQSRLRVRCRDLWGGVYGGSPRGKGGAEAVFLTAAAPLHHHDREGESCYHWASPNPKPHLWQAQEPSLGFS
jgi:hypothetical protein